MLNLHRYTALVAVSLLAACGGGGGGGGPQTVFTSQTFNEFEVAGDSTVRAVGMTRNAGGEVTGNENRQGTLTRETQALEIAGLVIDADGVPVIDGERAQAWSDGSTTVNSNLQPATAAIFNGSYDFFLPVEVTRSGGGAEVYLVGVSSRTADLPATGSAVFSGQASVGGIDDGAGGGSGAFKATGDTTLTANFGTGLVDVVMDSLQGTGAPIDRIEIANMDITDNAGDAIFSSADLSAITMFDGQTEVTPIGVLTDFDSTGAFFGGENTAAGAPLGPVEAGGTFYATGPDGQIWGIFAADERTQLNN
eukprot:TRINITY_DN71303_c0_g1_i1.p1 TRINITY_DN71303_c0_g1~~TRINITY_DN71303_c0_g1_i1.p1  ORF type:complete len:308 (-),score=76.94 TRINITY_DN71303_c0_g1_i1:815-1738(-)